MSLKKINGVKADKGFKIFDLIIYAAIAALIVALFIIFVFVPDKSGASDITVYYKNQPVYTYSFETQTGRIIDGEHISVDGQTAEGLSLTFYGADRNEKNSIYIDKINKSVDVTEANCSTRKDCVHMDKITDKSKVIICSPHNMKIQPQGYEYDPDAPIVVG